MTRDELIESANVPISAEDRQTLIDLLSVCDRILDKYPRSNNDKCSYLTDMGRVKDGIKDVKSWCEDLSIKEC